VSEIDSWATSYVSDQSVYIDMLSAGSAFAVIYKHCCHKWRVVIVWL